MPIFLWTSIACLLRGLSQGYFPRTRLFHLIFLTSLAVSLACDPSTLPRGVQISRNGPVLKGVCEPGLQPMEVMHATTSAIKLPVPSRRKFARYICIEGKYQRINAKGIENSSFLCAERESSSCGPIDHSALSGQLHLKGALALWRPVSPEAPSSILYCVHGNWYRLGSTTLPSGVTVTYQTPTPPSLLLTTSDPTLFPISSPSTESEGWLELEQDPSPILFLPPKHRPQRTRLLSPPSSSLQIQLELSMPQSFELPADVDSSGGNDVTSPFIYLDLYDRFHQCTRVGFYCLLALGALLILSGFLAIALLYHRRARIASRALEAQKHIRDVVNTV